MRLSPILVVIAVCLQQGCLQQGRRVPTTAGIRLGVIPAMADSDGSDRDGFTWVRVTNGLQEQGFDLAGGATAYGHGCWTADASVFEMPTTLFIDRGGQIFEEFPPSSCSQPAARR